AVVFAGEREFVAQCRKDEVKWIPGLLGYYNRSTNRINLFEPDGEFVRVDPGPWKTPFTAALASPAAGILDVPQLATAEAWGSIDASVAGGLKETIVHEATHQLAFNLGLHS